MAGEIIIKKVKKGGHSPHGGAWKVAYADFVTAMMAFFLLLWLLNSVTQEQLEGISNYFAPAALSAQNSGAGDILGGSVIGEDGAMPDTTARPSITVDLPPPKAGTGGEEFSGENSANSPGGEATEEDVEELARKKEEEEFQDAEEEIRDAIEKIPNMKDLVKSLLIDNTPEGLRIQIVDQEDKAMFPSGSADMFHHTRRVLELVARVIMKMPQKISIAGHTDATKFANGDTGYTNWELSADRANASRRALIDLGVPLDRVQNVNGRAATEPLIKENPEHPRNRRISITMLRGTGDRSAPEQPDDAEGAEGAASAMMPDGDAAAADGAHGGEADTATGGSSTHDLIFKPGDGAPSGEADAATEVPTTHDLIFKPGESQLILPGG